jgi:hypothetical protein
VPGEVQTPIAYSVSSKQATIISKVETRRLSGYVETAFKGMVADKTNWRSMLKEHQPDLDLFARADDLKAKFRADVSHISDISPKER